MTRRNRTIWALLVVVLFVGTTGAFAQLLDPSTLTKYIDPLPQPPVRTPDGRYNGFPLYNVHLKAAKQKMHSQLDSTNVFTFDGATPGATFLVEMGQQVAVRYFNDLPQNHMFNVDTNIHVMRGQGWGQSSRFVSHLHGGDVESQYDGWCMDFIYPGQQTTYLYPNSQPGATLWYHDHSCGVTRLNAYAGIAGFYLITDPREKRLNLPTAQLGIAVQDRMFYENGQLYYPEEWVPEFFGDVALVNGVVWPMQDVEPRKYRIRFLNGCNDRFLNMKLVESTHEGYIGPESTPGPAIYMIGSEQGLVNNTFKFNDPNDPNSPRLLVGPGDRRDLIIDFAGQQGKCFIMTNNAAAPFDGTFPPDPENPLPELFMFCVKDTNVVDKAEIPMHPGNVETPKPNQACQVRDIVMEEMADSLGNPMMVMLNGLHFMDPITDFPEFNCTEIWRYINTTMDEHPMHIHLVNSQILDRQPFDMDTFMLTRRVVFTGPAVPPAPEEAGRHDMTNCPPGYVTRVLTSKFNRLGKYVYHCHILAHEENDMMRPYEVVLPHHNGGGMIAGDVPTGAWLSSVGPEPFVDRSGILYSVPTEQHVQLKVYNSAGQEVKTLVNQTVKGGAYHLTWNATDNAGARVAAGTYFYKLTTATEVSTQRTTLLR